jgi:pilus assembly protein CpaB
VKPFKNRSLIALICLALAGVVAFGMLPQFYMDREATTSVYRAAAYIPKGTLITSRHIVSVETGAFNLPDAVITEPDAIIGQYALTDIPKDDLFLPDKIGDFLFSETLDTLMKRKQRLVTVTLPSNASGVSGHLQAGDVVSVVIYTEEHERFVTDEETGYDVREIVPAETVLIPELQSITVFALENAKTESLEELRSAVDSATDLVPKTVTLIVTEEQAIKLIEAENTGKIHLVFERRDT